MQGGQETVYIAGPMSGISGNNTSEFDAAERYLAGIFPKVINPAALDRACGVLAEEAADEQVVRKSLGRDMLAICDRADAILLLEGWNRSQGAIAEAALGLRLGLKFYRYYSVWDAYYPVSAETVATIVSQSITKNICRKRKGQAMCFQDEQPATIPMNQDVHVQDCVCDQAPAHCHPTSLHTCEAKIGDWPASCHLDQSAPPSTDPNAHTHEITLPEGYFPNPYPSYTGLPLPAGSFEDQNNPAWNETWTITDTEPSVLPMNEGKGGAKSTDTVSVESETGEVGLRKFESGAVRSSDADDERFDLIHPIAMIRLAKVYGAGGKRYGDHNYLKGIPASNVLNHLERHIALWKLGNRDEDHLAHAAWGLCTLLVWSETRPDLMDVDFSKFIPAKASTEVNV